jgi:hypothetical protein
LRQRSRNAAHAVGIHRSPGAMRQQNRHGRLRVAGEKEINRHGGILIRITTA